MSMAPRQNTTFGARLRSAREAAGLTQEALAEKAGLSFNAVSALERGTRRHPYPATIQALADALALSEPERVALLAAVPKRHTGAAEGTLPALTWPEPLTPLIGRVDEVAAVNARLRHSDVRVLTLTGTGGIGKTRMALAAAEMAADHFPDGVMFIALDAVRRADLVVPAIADALRLREQSGQGRAEQLAAFLRGKRLLLVLDNFEQVLAAGTEVAALVAAARTVKVLVTSRAPLRVAGEQEMPVPPLALAGDRSTPQEMLATEAVRLFVERARAHAPTLSLDGESVSRIADICERLDGLPLAIELAAARIKVHSPRQLHALLEQRLPLLTRGARNAPSRHGTMRDAIAWSYELLAPEEQRLFRWLAVFAGGFTLEAAAEMGSPPFTVDTIENLLDQSLLVSNPGLDGEPRFGMLETIREFGLEQLTATGDEAGARTLHAHAFLSLARTLRPWVTVHARQAPLDQLAAEAANVQAALSWLETHGPPEAFAELVAALSEYWLSLSLYREGQHWFERALRYIDRASAPDQARLLTGYAGTLMGQGQFSRTEPLLSRALPLSRVAGDPLDTAWTLILCGSGLNGSGNYRDAEASLQEAIALAERISDPALSAAVAGRALANLSISARGQGDGARATQYSERAISVYDGHGLDLAEAISRMDLGASAHEAGDYALAVRHWCEGLAITGDRGDMRQIADALSGIAGVATVWGAHHAALLLFGAAEALRERVGAAMLWPFDVAAADRRLTEVQNALGQQEAEATLAQGRMLSLAEAIAIAETITHPEATAIADT